MTVEEFVKLLEGYKPNAVVRFSLADDSSDDSEERWFVEDGIYDHFGDSGEVTLCLVAQSNYDQK